ncbi:hypothetical protein RF55_8039 [Lasius niger]|uniref:Zonadhesin n=1 Tax=Lasius niger TaxID=67767 RepID=A0A0J7KNX6_LASNI|nr:hypothetical protein RF55_8039 [Lasius niger]
MSSQLIIRGIGCTLTMLLVLSVQAIDYEVHRNDVTPKLNGNIILTNRDLLEQLNLVEPKESYTLQEGTERLLYFGALLRARLLDTFGSLLYIYYDDFSIAEVQALHKIHQEIFERRYDVFDLVPAILRNPDTRPSKICAGIYTHAESCLKSSASICRRIRPQHDLPHPEDLSTPALNVTYLAYRLSKISRQYLGRFSLAALLKLLQREVLTITPDLLSGLLYNVRYDNFDDDVRLAERELVQSFRKIAQTTKIPLPLPTMELKKFRTVNSFLKYYVNIYAEKLSDDDLKRHAFLIGKRIVDDVGTIDENIYLLGNVYENRTINIKYLFDLVLPDDLLDNDVIEAKKYLVKKLNEFDVVEKYLKVQKYQQATPLQLTMEITGQLKDIDFAKSIAISLRIHARFWRSSRMIESLDELLELFDAYENLRQVPLYDDMMQKIDSIKKTLWAMKDIPVELLCNAPRACLQIGLQSLLYCRYVSFEIKELIRDFFKLSNICNEYHSCDNYNITYDNYSITYDNYNITYNDYIYNIAYNDYNIAYNNYNNVTKYNNFAYNDYYNVAYSDYYNITYDYYNVTYDYYNVTYDYYNITYNDHYITYYNYYIAHNNHYNRVYNNYCNITHNDHYFYIIHNNYCDISKDRATNPHEIESSTSVTTSASTRSCESNECSSEQSSEKTSEETTTTQASTLESTRTTSPELSTTSQEVATTETTVTSTTESSETSVTKEECRSKSESIETSGTSCETSCDSVVEDCDDSVIKDTSEKVENHTVKCSNVRCKENSPEISSDCETETDKSCECVSKEEKSAECMTLCRSDSSSCEEKRNDCSKSEVPTINMKLERTRKRVICEIRDPHHRRQMRRLAKMRAISAALATSHADVLGSKAPRHRNRIASKKLYNLLAAKLSHAKDGKSGSIAEYLLKRPFSLSRIEGAGRKRKQQEQVYRLRRRLVRKLRRKLTGRTSMHRSRSTPLHQSQIERISRKDAKSINAAADQKGVQD